MPRRAEIVHGRGLDLSEARRSDAPDTAGVSWGDIIGQVTDALRAGRDIAPTATEMDTWLEVAADEAHRRGYEPSQPVVYYMRVGNRVKIGTTRDLPARLAVFQPEELLATEPGGVDVERVRHNEFADCHVNNEWFEYGPRLAEHVKRLTGDASHP